MSSRGIAVCLEVTPKQAVASALDWPGWCRAGRDEGAALQALAGYAERYAPVAARVGVGFPSTVAFEVVERVPGGPPAAARRLAGLVAAAWATFEEVAAASPAQLRKGPRGGGRDRDELIGHVIGAEAAYARKLGVKRKRPAIDDVAAIEELREAVTAVLDAPSDGSPVVPNGWTTRYAARRIAWHVLEHAWEMQD